METAEALKKSRRTEQFKSYYVVWKPRGRQVLQCDDKGLNRTMQYGNAKNPLITAIGLFV